MKYLVMALTTALGIVLLALGWIEQNPEWAHYQRGFLELARERAQNAAQADWYLSQKVEIQQISVEPLARVDRCATCHLAVTDPHFKNAPEPFRAHSDLAQSHPPEQFGCTICHGGEGRAVTALAAHGLVPNSATRMLRGEYLQAACSTCHTQDTLPPRFTREIVAGETAMNQWRCLRCHQLDGRGENEGPDLSTIGARRDALELYAHLLNPPAVTIGSTMPIFPLTRAEAQSITIYLLTRRAGQQSREQRGTNDMRYLARNPAPRTAELPELVGTSTAAPILASAYDGREFFWGAGCGICHRVGNAGGVVGPALTHIGRVRDRDWLRRFLADPSIVRPQGRMPQMYLNERAIDALVDFLSSLK